MTERRVRESEVYGVAFGTQIKGFLTRIAGMRSEERCTVLEAALMYLASVQIPGAMYQDALNEIREALIDLAYRG